MTASANVDYEAKQNLHVTVGVGQSTSVQIQILDDRIVEQDEIFEVEISGTAVGVGIKLVNVIIVDEDRKLIINYHSIVFKLPCRLTESRMLSSTWVENN